MKRKKMTKKEIGFDDLEEIRKDPLVRIFSVIFRSLQGEVKLNSSKLLYLLNVENRVGKAKGSPYDYPAFYSEKGDPYYLTHSAKKERKEEKKYGEKQEHKKLDDMRGNLKEKFPEGKFREEIKNLKEDDVHNKLRKMVRCNILEKKLGGSVGKKDYYYFELDEFKFSLFEDMVTKEYHQDKLEKYDLEEIERIDENHTVYGIDNQKYDSVQNLKEKMKFLVSKHKLKIEEEVNKRKAAVIEEEYENQLDKVNSEKLNRLLSIFYIEICRGFNFNFKSITDIYTTLLLKEDIIKQGKIDKDFLIDRLKKRYFRLTFSDIFKLCEDIKKFKKAPEEEIHGPRPIPKKIEDDPISLNEKIGELIDEGYTFKEAKEEVEDDKKQTHSWDIDFDKFLEIVKEKGFEYEEIKGFEEELLSDNYTFVKSELFHLKREDDIVDGVVKNYVEEEDEIYWTKSDQREGEGFEITITDPLFEEIADLSEKEKEKLKDFEIEVFKNVIDELIALDKSKKNFFLVQTGNSFSDEITDKLKIACEGSELSFLGDEFLLDLLREYESEENSPWNRTHTLKKSPELDMYLWEKRERSGILIFNFFLDGPFKDNEKLYEALFEIDESYNNVLSEILDREVLEEKEKAKGE